MTNPLSRQRHLERAREEEIRQQIAAEKAKMLQAFKQVAGEEFAQRPRVMEEKSDGSALYIYDMPLMPGETRRKWMNAFVLIKYVDRAFQLTYSSVSNCDNFSFGSLNVAPTLEEGLWEVLARIYYS